MGSRDKTGWTLPLVSLILLTLFAVNVIQTVFNINEVVVFNLTSKSWQVLVVTNCLACWLSLLMCDLSSHWWLVFGVICYTTNYNAQLWSVNAWNYVTRQAVQYHAISVVQSKKLNVCSSSTLIFSQLVLSHLLHWNWASVEHADFCVCGIPDRKYI